VGDSKQINPKTAEVVKKEVPKFKDTWADDPLDDLDEIPVVEVNAMDDMMGAFNKKQ